MNARQILDRFYTWVDDRDLGDEEALILANEEYRGICEEREWEFLKRTMTGLQTSLTVPWIALPTNFGRLISKDTSKQHKVIRVGANRQQYREVPYDLISDNSNNSEGWYIDYDTNRIYFTKQPTTVLAVEFDYLYNPDDLVLLPSPTSPVFPMEGAHQAIALRMAANYPIIEGAEKARSYRNELKEEAELKISRMRRADALRKTVK